MNIITKLATGFNSIMRTGGSKGYDIYRDSYLRYLGYSDEIGKALRPLWPRHISSNLSYVVTAYICADAYHKGSKMYQRLGSSTKDVALTVGDVLLWQMFASVIIPGFTLNKIAYGTHYVVRRLKVPNPRYIPTAVVLVSIPFIIKPIDRLMDYVMDNTYRKCFN